MNQYDLINMYKTFIEPYFLYGIEIWGHSVRCESDHVKRAQNKALRIVYECFRTNDAWDQNDRILNIEDLYKKVISRTCYKHHAKLLPKYFTDNVMPRITYYREKRTEKTRQTCNNILNYDNLDIGDYQNKNPFVTNCIDFWI